MIKRFVLGFAVLALSIASAETYRVNLNHPSTVKGTELKAGEYKLDVQNGKAVIDNGKQKVEVPVKVENADQKFGTTSVVYTEENGKRTIHEIQLRGTKTKLLFDSGIQAAGGGD
jgi:hypothetical protein